MGEAGVQATNPESSINLTTNGVTQQESQDHLNSTPGTHMSPPLMRESIQMPVIQTGHSQTLEATAVIENQEDSLLKGVSTSTSLKEAADVEKQESTAEEDSDWSEAESEVHPGLPLASLPSGLCYDVQMRYHCEVRPTSDVHPEDPRRIYYIYKELCRAGLVDDIESTRPLVAQPLRRIGARNATEEEISLVHTEAHYAFVKSTKGGCFLSMVLLEISNMTGRHV